MKERVHGAAMYPFNYIKFSNCSTNWNLPFIVTYNSKESYCKKDGTNKQK